MLRPAGPGSRAPPRRGGAGRGGTGRIRRPSASRSAGRDRPREGSPGPRSPPRGAESGPGLLLRPRGSQHGAALGRAPRAVREGLSSLTPRGSRRYPASSSRPLQRPSGPPSSPLCPSVLGRSSAAAGPGCIPLSSEPLPCPYGPETRVRPTRPHTTPLGSSPNRCPCGPVPPAKRLAPKALGSSCGASPKVILLLMPDFVCLPVGLIRSFHSSSLSL